MGLFGPEKALRAGGAAEMALMPRPEMTRPRFLFDKRILCDTLKSEGRD
jgi:hypothetical protein